MDPGLVACIKAGQHIRSPITRDAAGKIRLHRRDPSLVRGLGLPADAGGFGRGVPGRTAEPDALAAAPWDWLSLGGVLLPVQHVLEPRGGVPCGFTTEGLPVGLQIVGRRFDDLGVLQASAAFEPAQPWASRRPPLD